MLPYLMSLVIGVSASDIPERSPTIEIVFGGTIVSAAIASADYQELLPGVYKVATKYISSEVNQGNLVQDSYLVVDRLGVLNSQALIVAFSDETKLKLPNEFVVAMKWPDLTDQQVVTAFKRSYRKGIALALKHSR